MLVKKTRDQRPFALTEISYSSIEIGAWISNDIHGLYGMYSPVNALASTPGDAICDINLD